MADLLIAGYPCNRNSILCTTRFEKTEGAGAVDNEHSDVLVDLVQLILKVRPRVFILENVTGVLNRRAGSSELADQNVLQWVHQQLDHGLKGDWKYQDFIVDSTPLHLACSAQSCLYHRQLEGHEPGRIGRQARNVSAYPVHHAFAFFKSTETNENTDPMEVDPEKQASYAASFKNAYDKAVQAKRLDKNQPVPDVSDRFSAKNVAQPFMTSASPWTKSQLDVFLEVSECMAMMGIKDYDFAGLNPTQSADLVGKAMCATALVKALVPVLELLEVLRST
eukprot:s6767_g1.t1